ncbi:solute carrier family 22 member 6-A isoform X1 [Brienomyrus brachyistius]|uniref:solute carrier family 22 member 6-A isoform X1 n=1 Tax=Brienomyrus brachyistius TaxID=42636 RepID=UPI0020B3BD0D|nr:solute carrier family 22 member 6-A isoform X1 [Brienomyrus brachyistius]
MNFDDILDKIGSFGNFQKTLHVWMCLPQIFLACHTLMSVFTGAVPPHICRSRWPLAGNQALPLNISQAAGPGGVPDLSCTALDTQELANLSSVIVLSKNHTTEGCAGGWEYSKEVFSSTVVTEWDLVCDKAKLNTIASSVYMFGLLVGALLSGVLADKYGRRIIILVALAVQATFGVGAAFAPNVCTYMFLRFVVGMTVAAVIMNIFVLGTEWTGQKHRMLAGLLTDYFFGLGYIMLAGVAYLIRDWRTLQLAISLPEFLFFFYIWVLPDSARWLITKGKKEEAVDLIQKAAIRNRNPLPPNFELFQQPNELNGEAKRKKGSLIDLVRTSRMRKRSLILFYLWFVNSLVYYGLSLNITAFGMNIYLTQFIFGLVEIPARTIILFTINRSRKICLICFFVTGGLACLSTIFVPDKMPVLRILLAMIGKFGITGSVSVIYIYSAEVFPTVIRQNGMGVSSMCARTGGIISPIMHLLASHRKEVPMAVFGVCPLLGAALALMLPETAGKPLPDTIKDVEQTQCREDAEQVLYKQAPRSLEVMI